MFNKFKATIILLLGMPVLLASCGDKALVCGSNELYPTPITDGFSFANVGDITKDNFKYATSGLAISEVKVSSYADGDTVNFYPASGNDDDKFRLRFLGVDTPESTGEVDPWGLKASLFTKKKLKSADSIVVINDINQFGKQENSGGRLLGFVWYRPKGDTNYRLLNLELIEQGYSLNTLQNDSAILVDYYSKFNEAHKVNEKKKIRVFGEDDCDFDNSGKVVETTIANAKENFDTLGVNSEEATSGTKLRITAIVTQTAGYNFYCRDVVSSSESDGLRSGIYCFTQYKSIDIKPGYIVRFYGKIAKHYGNYQITDIESSTIASNYAFEILARTKEEAEALGYDYDFAPYEMKAEEINSIEDFEKYNGNYVTTTFKVSDRDDYVTKHTGADGKTITYTVYGSINNLPFNIRLESHPILNSEENIKAFLAKGKTYKVSLFVNAFKFDDDSELEYQASLPSKQEVWEYIEQI